MKPKPISKFKCLHCRFLKPHPGKCPNCGKRNVTVGRPAARFPLSSYKEFRTSIETELVAKRMEEPAWVDAAMSSFARETGVTRRGGRSLSIQGKPADKRKLSKYGR